MKVDLNGRVAIVTGGSGGIGGATCRELAACGANVYICDINDEAGSALEKEICEAGGTAKYMHCNIFADEECKNVVDDAVNNYGRVDILINNAGGNIPLNKRGKIREYDVDGWDFSINVCMDGFYHLNKYAVPVMKAQNYGRIVNTGSVTGFRMGLRYQCAYNIAKAAIHNMTRCLAIEYAKYGITVNSVIPGTTWHKAFFDGLVGGDDGEHVKAKFLSHIPLGEPNIPDDMGNAFLYFCSPEAERVTGVLLNVDGGWASGYCKG